MNRYLTEFIGAFFLVLTICLVVSSEAQSGGVLIGSITAGVTIGSILMVMVYMGGHISGAHYNPAVTAGVAARGGAMRAHDVWPYMGAQVLGGLAAAAVAWAVTGTAAVPAPAEGVGVAAALLVELLFTFALALVVLNVATAPETKGNSYFGLAIGFTITAAAYAGGGISGGAFNPAVGVGMAVISALDGGPWAHAWIYIVGPIVGGLLAAAVYRLQHGMPVMHRETPAPRAPAAHA